MYVQTSRYTFIIYNVLGSCCLEHISTAFHVPLQHQTHYGPTDSHSHRRIAYCTQSPSAGPAQMLSFHLEHESRCPTVQFLWHGIACPVVPWAAILTGIHQQIQMSMTRSITASLSTLLAANLASIFQCPQVSMRGSI
jgi:hypothetical protein